MKKEKALERERNKLKKRIVIKEHNKWVIEFKDKLKTKRKRREE